jgi:hypothetical protein
MNHIALSGLVAFADAARQLLRSFVLPLLCCTVALQFRVMKQAKCVTKVIKIGLLNSIQGFRDIFLWFRSTEVLRNPTYFFT